MSDDSEAISVVICAHNRRKYLVEAIRSALEQTVERSRYEIIVVKNFNDGEIDAFMEQNGVISIVSDVPNLSNKQYLGIERSKGGIICFMDDDDLFEPGKLEVIFRTFARGNHVSFVHNGMLFVDSHGTEIQSGKDFLSIEYDSSSCNPSAIKRMISEMASYNPSSMAISRDLATSYSQNLNKIFREVDTFWFLCALDFGKTVSIIPDRLTRYRRTSGGLSKATDPLKFLEYSQAAIANVEIMKSISSSDSAKLFIRLKEREWQAKRAIFNRELGSRGARIDAMAKLIKIATLFPIRDLTKLLSLLILSTVSEERALKLYPKFYT